MDTASYTRFRQLHYHHAPLLLATIEATQSAAASQALAFTTLFV